MGRRRRRPPTPLFLRFVVAAVNSRDPTVAHFVCNGVADEAEINLAFAALGAAEGVVELLDGDFTTAASIAFTANHQTLRGQGRATRINGTALGAGVHAVVNSGFTHCTIRDLAVETNAGGGLSTHCVFIEDGAHEFLVENVFIINSDDDGIHVEGTTINLGHMHMIHVEAADGDGIFVDMDVANFANRFHVEDCDVIGCGGIGIHFGTTGSNEYCQIINNIVYNSGGVGIILYDGDYSMVRGNICLGNGEDGISIPVSEHAQILGNICQGNGDDGLTVGGASDYCSIVGNLCQGNTEHGISLGTSEGLTVTGNTCNGNTQHGINLSTVEKSTVTGNTCNGNTQHGIYIAYSKDNTVVGNVCDNNDSEETNAWDGISFTNASRNLLSGNQCQANHRHGIFVDGNSDDNKIIGNYLANNVNGDMTVGAAACDHTEIVWNTIEDGAIGDAGTLTRASGNFDPSANAYIAPIGANPW